MPRTRELLRSIKNLRILREIAVTEGSLNGVGDLIDNFLESEAMVVSIARFKALPGGAEMMEQRFPAFQPNIETLELLPEGTLGRAYAGMIRRLNYDADFFRPRDTSTEALWLTQRIATTHDIHHVIAGLNTQAQGESAVLAITATQIGFPAYVLLNLLASFKAFRFQPADHEAISRAIAHGQRIGLQAKPLVLQRWEEGWEKPLSQWREELAIPMATGETFSANYE